MTHILQHVNAITSPALKATEDDDKFIENYCDKTCAVIGNGGVILDYEDGKKIDNHDIVIRNNQTPLGDYQKHTGSRTDIRMVNSHYFVALKGTDFPSNSNFIPHMKAVHPKFDENYLYTLENEIIIVKYGVQKNLFKNEIKRIEEKNNQVLFLTPEFYNFCSRLVGTHPTNGFVAMLLAIKFFQKVSYFGFGFYCEDKKHYYQTINEDADNPSCHNNLIEKKFFSQLEENNLISRRGEE